MKSVTIFGGRLKGSIPIEKYEEKFDKIDWGKKKIDIRNQCSRCDAFCKDKMCINCTELLALDKKSNE